MKTLSCIISFEFHLLIFSLKWQPGLTEPSVIGQTLSEHARVLILTRIMNFLRKVQCCEITPCSMLCNYWFWSQLLRSLLDVCGQELQKLGCINLSPLPPENYGFNWAIGKVCSFSSFDIPQVKGKSNQLRRSMRGKASVNTGAGDMIERKRDFKSEVQVYPPLSWQHFLLWASHWEGGTLLRLKGSFSKFLWKLMSFF